MRFQLWQYALLRPATWVPVGLGAWAIISRSWVGLGAALIVYGLYQAMKLVNETPDGEERIYLRKEKKRYGIHRSLNPKEQKCLLQLIHYTKRLEKLGGDPTLVQEVWSQAWLAVETNQDKNRNQQLEALLASLPEIHPSGAKPQEDLMNRLRKECEIIYASQAEANASSNRPGY